MKINIYQINRERDMDGYMFFGLEEIERYKGETKVRSEIYDKAFSGDVNCSSLEGVYRRFNEYYPVRYSGRSLSVSDVIEVLDDKYMEKGFYFCNNLGFKKIDFEPEKTVDLVSKDQISVIFCQVKQPPEIISMENKLEAMQFLVDGNIEEYMPFEDDVAIVCNEEGKLRGLRLNRAVYDEKTNKINDIICGDFFIAYAPLDSENYKDLPKDLEKKYMERFKYPERFFREHGEIKAYPIKPVNRDNER